MKKIFRFTQRVFAATAVFLILSAPLSAGAVSDMKKTRMLQEERLRLSADFVKKQQELNEITLKIHNIDQQLEELKQARQKA
jgi:hypothetical protein